MVTAVNVYYNMTANRRISRFFVVGLLLIVVNGPAHARQSGKPVAEKTLISLLQDGNLSNRTVFDISFAQDSTVWLATSQGIATFDGVRWNHFGLDAGLPSAFVRAVHVDNNGGVWAGTDRGVAIRSGSGFVVLPDSLQPVGGNIRRISSSLDGSVWIATDNWLLPDRRGGVTIYTPSVSSGTVRTTTKHSTHRFHREMIVDLFFADSGQAAVATTDGYVDGRPGAWGSPVKKLAGDSLGTVWAVWDVSDSTRFVSAETGLYRIGVTDTLKVSRNGQRVMDFNHVRLIRNHSGRSLGLASSGLVWEFSTGEARTSDTRYAIPPEFESASVGPDGALWIMGNRTLVRGVSTSSSWNRISDRNTILLQDEKKRTWLLGNGLLDVFDADSLVNRFDHPLLSSDVFASDAGQDGVWVWNGSTAALFNADDNTSTVVTASGLGLERIVALSATPSTGEANLVGLSGENTPILFRRGATGWYPVVELPVVPSTPLVPCPDSGVCFLGSEGYRLFHARADTVSSIPLPSTTSSSRIPKLTSTRDGRVWLLAESGLFQYEGTRIRHTGLTTHWPTAIAYEPVVGEGEYEGLRVLNTGFAGTEAGVWWHDGLSWQSQDLEDPILFSPQSSELAWRDGPFLMRFDTSERGLWVKVRIPQSLTIRNGLIGDDGTTWLSTPEGVFVRHPEEARLHAWLPDGPIRVQGREPVSVDLESRLHFQPRNSASAMFSIKLGDRPWTMFKDASRLDIHPDSLSRRITPLRIQARLGAGPAISNMATSSIERIPIPLQDRWFFLPGVLGIAALLTILLGVVIAGSLRYKKLADSMEERVIRRTARLQELRLRLQQIIAESPMGILVLNEEGRVLQWNPAATEIFGWTEPEVIGRIPPFTKGQEEDYIRHIQTALDHPVRYVPVTRVNRNGETLQLVISEASTRDPVSGEALVVKMIINMTEIESSRVRLQELSRALISIQEAERRRIASELHDEVGGALTTLIFSQRRLMDYLDEHAAPSMESQIKTTKELITKIRTFSHALRPSELDDFGLVAAVQSLIEGMRDMSGFVVDLRLPTAGLPDLRDDVSTAAYRIIQETLTNVARHSGVFEASVSLDVSRNHLVITIEDDGKGFMPGKTHKGSSGVTGMRQRAEYLGGTLRIDSSPSSGTRIESRLPL